MYQQVSNAGTEFKHWNLWGDLVATSSPTGAYSPAPITEQILPRRQVSAKEVADAKCYAVQTHQNTARIRIHTGWLAGRV